VPYAQILLLASLTGSASRGGTRTWYLQRGLKTEDAWQAEVTEAPRAPEREPEPVRVSQLS
jgi:hypothetical protein